MNQTFELKNIWIREVMSNMEKCGHSKSDQVDHQKIDDIDRNHPANKKDESEFNVEVYLNSIFLLICNFTTKVNTWKNLPTFITTFLRFQN